VLLYCRRMTWTGSLASRRDPRAPNASGQRAVVRSGPRTIVVADSCRGAPRSIARGRSSAWRRTLGSSSPIDRDPTPRTSATQACRAESFCDLGRDSRSTGPRPLDDVGCTIVKACTLFLPGLERAARSSRTLCRRWARDGDHERAAFVGGALLSRSPRSPALGIGASRHRSGTARWLRCPG